jgi:hypothetical protein
MDRAMQNDHTKGAGVRVIGLAVALACAMVALAVGSASAALPTATIVDGQNTLGVLTSGVTTSMPALSAPVAGQPLFGTRSDGHMPAGLDVTGAFNGSPAGIGNDKLAIAIQSDGMDLARIPAPWYEIEPIADQYHFARLDALYVALVDRGIRPVIQLLTSPSWAIGYSSKTLLGVQTKDNGCSGTWCVQPPSPGNYDRWRRFAAQIAKRYRLSAAIEVWNEPNLWGFWHAYNTDPGVYTALLGAAYDAIKDPSTGNPSMRVLGGALNNATSWTNANTARECTQGANLLQRIDCGASDKWNIPIGDYLDMMLADGAGSKMDGLSFHAYPADASLTYFSGTNTAGPWYTGAYPTVKKVLARHGASGMRLVDSEVGIPTAGYGALSQATGTTRIYHDMEGGISTPNGTATTDAALFFEAFDPSGTWSWLKTTALAAPNANHYAPYGGSGGVYCAMAARLASSPPPGC